VIDTAKCLTTSQASRILGVCDQSVRLFCRQGKLPHLITPHGALFDPADVEQLRRERESRIAGALQADHDQLTTGSPAAARAR